MQTSRCGPSIQILSHVTLHPNEHQRRPEEGKMKGVVYNVECDCGHTYILFRWNRKNIKHQVKRTQMNSYTRRRQKWYIVVHANTPSPSTYHPMGQCTDHGQRGYLVQEKSQRSTKNTRRKTNNEPRQWLKSQPHFVPTTTIITHFITS